MFATFQSPVNASTFPRSSQTTFPINQFPPVDMKKHLDTISTNTIKQQNTDMRYNTFSIHDNNTKANDRLTRIQQTEGVHPMRLLDHLHDSNQYSSHSSANSINLSSHMAVDITSYFNNQGFHTPAIALSAVFDAISRTASPVNNNNPVSITTTNHPLPRTSHDQVAGKTSTDYRGFILALHIVIGMAFLSGSFALFIVRERVVRVKHSQLVSGASVLQFWTSTFIWDLFNYLIPCILLLILFACFNINAYCEGHRLGLLLLLLLLYGFASLPLMYNLSMLFSIPSSAFVWLSMFNLFSGKALFTLSINK